MQRIRKLKVSLRGVSNRLWTYFLLFYSGLLFTFLTLGIPAPSILVLPFSLFVPGYAFVAVVFPRLRGLEKVVTSIGFSIGLIVGIKSFMQTFAETYLFSELAVLTIFSAACLIVKLIKQ